MPAIIPANLILLMMLTQLAGFVVALAKNREANSTVGWVACCITFLGLGLSGLIFLSASPSTLPYLAGIEWFTFGGKPFLLGVFLDQLGVLMLLLVNFIGLLVQVFSLSYMHKEPDRYRYYAFLSLFIFAMLGLVTSRSLFVIYFFWELVGLSSYLLVGFWHTKPEAVAAAKKAFVVNRIGDAMLMVGIFYVYRSLGTTDFSEINQCWQGCVSPTWVGVLLFGGAVAKSAQFPLHVWLPDAMEGPTPVSALIHAATMVAAGIFLLARVFPLLSPGALSIIAIIGAFTALLGGLYALAQFDLKKVLAYSTISQLGLMVMGMGVGAPAASVFHLFTHAFFKAGLFLSAGAIIHALHRINHAFDAQDMRLMGGLRSQLPVTFWCYTLCAAALAGLPLFSGFLSKDALLAGAWYWASAQANPLAYLIPLAGFASAGLTAFYMARQWVLIFTGDFRNPIAEASQVQETSIYIKIPLLLLAIGSLGFAFSWNPLSAEHSWFFQLIPNTTPELHWISVVATLLAVGGIYVSYQWFSQDPFRLLNWTVNIDALYTRYVISPLLRFSKLLYWADQQLVDGLVNAVATLQVSLANLSAWTDAHVVDGLVNGTAKLAGRVGKLTRSVQSGKIQLYVAVAVIGVLWLIMMYVK
ncbi:MAG: NADH-quinone oxidoreductase subunit L [Spirosomataceae bacterium]